MSATTPLYRPPGAFDALQLPLLRRITRWRWGRLVFQLPLLAVALLLMYDGFTGPQNAAQNLATVAPWVHYRGLVIVALLLVGNLFCMGCPFTLPRTLAKRLSSSGRRFPRWLRSKWLAIGGLFLLFFLYEWLDFWASPALTAWVIVFYFVASFVLEAVFSESAFCKYVCPLGTFNFVYSTVSPLQIRAKNTDICKSCVGKECINGSYAAQPVILINQIGTNGEPPKTHAHNRQGTLGCGTELFAPQMQSSMDCTLCLDCVRACPHDNVGLLARAPGAELTRPDALPKRYDMAFLFICLAFMGLVNAFGMVPPVYDLLQSIATSLGLTALGWTDTAIEGVALGLVFVVGALLLPIALSLGAAALTRLLTRTQKRDLLRVTLASFAPAFVPIGFGFWAAHYGFHFLIGMFTIIPVFQNFLIDHRITVLGQPDWSLGGVTDLGAIGLFQTVCVLGGFIASMVVAQRTALRLYRRDGMPGFLPWALMFLLMMLAGVWLFRHPMEMRGTVLFD
ncbi:MAG: FesM [Chloroflexota bacterium]|nr:FesM [Chloroflexota bacterium]